MTVFKTYFNILKKYIGIVLLYTIMLIIFGGINMTTSDNNLTFINSKPDVLIINNDKDGNIAKNLVKYISDNSNIMKIKNDEYSIDDALFYRDVNYIIYIPSNYSKDILSGLRPTIDIKSTKEYQASLAEMMLTRYLKIQNIYLTKTNNESELLKLINNNLGKNTDIELTSKLDITNINRASSYFSFASYSVMAIVIYVICIILSSFRETNISKRTVISSMNYKEYNSKLLLSSIFFSIFILIFFILLAYILLGNIILTSRGLIYIINLGLFILVSLTIALLISNLINNKNAISGIVNVEALGQAFLCGAFVPTELLPKGVLTIAHILPAYWYINTNDLLKTIEVISLDTIKPILINFLVLVLFIIFYIIINNIISKTKQSRN